MKTINNPRWHGLIPLILAAILFETADVRAQTGLVIAATNLFGGAGDQRGTGLSISGGALYFSGTTDANGGDGVVGRYALPLTNNQSSTWSAVWPGLAFSDDFLSVAAGSDAFYAVGSSYGRTTDSSGGKENKGITVKFPLTGATGGGFGGDIWDVQTPAAPGVFGYGGGENLQNCTLASEGGVPFVYATGSGQVHGGNGGRLFVSKLTTNGIIVWTRDDSASMVGSAYSVGLALASMNGNVYVAGHNNDSGARAYLRKYDSAGVFAWTRTGTNGAYFAVTAYDGYIYAVGEKDFSGSANFLIDKWDEAGNLVWSRFYDRNGTEDYLRGVVALRGRLYAAGLTRGNTSGGADACVLEIDPANGDLLSTTLYGGVQDDIANGIATDGSDLYVIGETKSYVTGGNGAGQNDSFLLRYRSAASLTIQQYAGLTINGSVGGTYRIDYVNSVTSTNWTTITIVTLPSNPYLFIDTGSPAAATRFYRAVLLQ